MRQEVSRELELVFLLLWHGGRDGDLDIDDLWLRGLRHLRVARGGCGVLRWLDRLLLEGRFLGYGEGRGAVGCFW